MEKIKAVGTVLLCITIIAFILFTVVVKSNRFSQCIAVNSFMYCSFTQRDFVLWDSIYPLSEKKS